MTKPMRNGQIIPASEIAARLKEKRREKELRDLRELVVRQRDWIATQQKTYLALQKKCELINAELEAIQWVISRYQLGEEG